TIITPTRLMVKWFGDDPLKRRWLPDAASYWEAPEEQPTEIERYRQQF
ncbi:MAG: hypothetical protein HYV26_15690, partial [Candidatus Hydrogenedentes bacterium]|nr:hypothetical protein [Candidatus Hydrogenedentota bacterium]